jgi:hypothetical protein
MGEHRFNPAAQARAEGKELVRALEIGEGCALLGVQLIPRIDEATEELVVQIAAVGGKDSPIMGFVPRPAIVCDLARVKLDVLRLVFAGGAAVPTGSPSPPATESPAPDASPSLVVVP